MNSRFLASTGGRFAHASLTLAFALAACAAFAPATAATYTWLALGLGSVVCGFIVSAILSSKEFHWYSLAIGVLVPMAGLCYVLTLLTVLGMGSAVGSAFAAIGAFVFIAGIVLGLPLAPTQAAGGAVRPAASEV